MKKASNGVLVGAALCLCLHGGLWALPGKVVLAGGHTLTGDIVRSEDGSLWVTMKKGSVKFEKDEVRQVVIYSRKDPVRDAFISSFKATPAKRTAARSRETPYENLIAREAQRNKLDPALVKAVIKAESNFYPGDRSSKGACGLMQLMPETARILGVKNIYSPQENIRAGARYLRDMLYLFGGDVEKALAAYNAGPGIVKKYRDIPPYRETRNYISNVQRYYRDYRRVGSLSVYTDDAGCLTIYNVR
ncbi:MAG: lytic transglycosylase domain-containing protein [Endomicrobiales bacterium]